MAQATVTANEESAILSMIRAGIGLNFMLEEPARRMTDAGELAIWEKERFAFPLSFVSLASEQDETKISSMVKAIGEIWQADASVLQD